MQSRFQKEIKTAEEKVPRNIGTTFNDRPRPLSDGRSRIEKEWQIDEINSSILFGNLPSIAGHFFGLQAPVARFPTGFVAAAVEMIYRAKFPFFSPLLLPSPHQFSLALFSPAAAHEKVEEENQFLGLFFSP